MSDNLNNLYDSVLLGNYTSKKITAENLYEQVLKETRFSPLTGKKDSNEEDVKLQRAAIKAQIKELDRSILYVKTIEQHLRDIGINPNRSVRVGINLGTNQITDSVDLKTWKALYELTPPKAGEVAGGTKGSGNGEMAVFWLLANNRAKNYEVLDNRGVGRPDLLVDGVGVEVKAYDNVSGNMLKIGKFRRAGGLEGKDNNILLNAIFGFNTLLSTLRFNVPNKLTETETPAQKLPTSNPGNFDGFVLKEAFANVEAISKAIDNAVKTAWDVNKTNLLDYDVFRYLTDNIRIVYGKLGSKGTPEQNASAMLYRLAYEKLKEKPGLNSYIVNASREGKLAWYKVNPNKLKKIGLGGAKASSSELSINLDLFN